MRGEPVPSASPEDPLTVLPGIGPKRAALFQEHYGITDLGGLLRLRPRAWEEPPVERGLAGLRDGETVRVRARVRSVSLFGRPRRRVVSVRLEDGEARARALWFRQPWLRERFQAGEEVLLEGRVSVKEGEEPRLLSPRLLEPGAPPARHLRPRYPRPEGFPAGLLERAVQAALPHAAAWEDPLPAGLRAAAGVPPLARALRGLHAPACLAEAEAARRRLAWEEVLERERRLRALPPPPRRPPGRAADPRVWARIRSRIPFALHEDQERALRILQADLGSGLPVRRLVHGEVGSGKTVLAFALALALAADGGQTALLAPTEVLARQHLRTFRTWLRGSRLQIAGVLGEDPPAVRRRALEDLAAGRASLAVGTHALLGEGLRFRRLEGVVFDEQHRFGVKQKARLLRHAERPHVLTMTATPIPRTLAWVRYGGLEPCVLRRRPGGGMRVRTRVEPEDRRWPELAEELRPRLEQGWRLFLVAPRLAGAGGLLEVARFLAGGPWKGLPLGCVHGRLEAERVEAEVERFRRGEAVALLGTTVVEVGLDVPGVPGMVVLDAGRLGLASLHQLRGRLARGRGGGEGECWFLVRPGAGEGDPLERLRFLETCADGFAVAEADLRERGPGTLRGLRQHGHLRPGAFDPLRDGDLLDLLKRPEVRAFCAGGRSRGRRCRSGEAG